MERSLKEAGSELKARLEAGRERRFPLMGVKGAANALMLRQAVIELARPIIAITSLASEAEALAGELAFFLDQPADCDAATARVHFLPAWEVRPLAHLSPPPDVQAAQLAALFAMIRTPAPVVVTSAEALMMRTLPRRVFEDSVIRLALAEAVDLDAMVEALAAMGYQRVPQTEEPGDFSVRGGIVDVFSPLYNNPVRIELEEDIVTSIRHFDRSSQRSLGEIEEVTVIRTRLVPPSILRDKHLADRVALRCAEIGMVRKETAELTETIENGLLFPGVELISPLIYEDGLDSVFKYVPSDAVAWMTVVSLSLGESPSADDESCPSSRSAASRTSRHTLATIAIGRRRRSRKYSIMPRYRAL